MGLSDCCRVCLIIFFALNFALVIISAATPSIMEVGIVLKPLWLLRRQPFRYYLFQHDHTNLTVFISTISANSTCISVNMGFDFGYMDSMAWRELSESASEAKASGNG
jgi:hypothetical protein